ncbi:MAG: collagen-like protein [Candidatus Competibacteraceae bacterium]
MRKIALLTFCAFLNTTAYAAPSPKLALDSVITNDPYLNIYGTFQDDSVITLDGIILTDCIDMVGYRECLIPNTILPGTYRLVVSKPDNNGNPTPPGQNSAELDITIGAAGPQGPQGDPGPQGPQGDPGPQGGRLWTDIDGADTSNFDIYCEFRIFVGDFLNQGDVMLYPSYVGSLFLSVDFSKTNQLVVYSDDKSQAVTDAGTTTMRTVTVQVQESCPN